MLLTAALTGLAAAVWLGLPREGDLRARAVLGCDAVRRAHLPPLQRLTTPVSRARRQERERERAVEACGVLAAELRAGRAAAAALEVAAPVAGGATSTALRAAASAASLGGDVPGALVPEGSASADLLRGLAACWAVCATTGSGLAAAVERLAEAERAAAEQRRAVEVELAGPRATARLLAVLPLGGLLMAAGLGAEPLSFLLGSAAGRVCLLVGVVLEMLGLRWTSRLAAGAVRSR